jgi:elongation factor P
MPQVQATQLRRGNTILHNGELHQVVDYAHITPGNWRGMVQTKLRRLSTGAIIDHRFRSEDRVERAVLDEREMEYLYKDGSDFHFMDTENYEQIHFNEELLGDAVNYLVPNSKVKVEFYEGRALGVELPATIDLRVVQTEPGMPSATATNVLKPAKLETGLTVGVPHFIQEGELIRVDTTEGKYVERVRT